MVVSLPDMSAWIVHPLCTFYNLKTTGESHTCKCVLCTVCVSYMCVECVTVCLLQFILTTYTRYINLCIVLVYTVTP